MKKTDFSLCFADGQQASSAFAEAAAGKQVSGENDFTSGIKWSALTSKAEMELQ